MLGDRDKPLRNPITKQWNAEEARRLISGMLSEKTVTGVESHLRGSGS